MAYLNLLGTEPGGLPPRAPRMRGRERSCPQRNGSRCTCRAVDCLARSHWHEAGRVLEDLSIRYPRDLLALQVGPPDRLLHRRLAHAARPHRARRCRTGTTACPATTRCCRCRPSAWRRPADYAARREDRAAAVELRAARRLGLARGGARAGDAEPSREGIAWMRANAGRGARAASSPCTTGGTWRCSTSGSTRSTRCSRCSTGAMLGTTSALVLDLIDASAMLWRLQLRGVPSGRPLERVADRWAPVAARATTPSTTCTR